MDASAALTTEARDAGPGFTPACVESRQRVRDGVVLFVRTWEPDDREFPEALGTVLLVHGLGEHCGRYAHVAARLCRLGLRVRAYDQRGHGRSEGPRMVSPHPNAYLEDLADICDAATQAWHELPILLGDSMGGLVVAHFATERVRPVRAVILAAPALALPLSAAARASYRIMRMVAPRARVPNLIRARDLSHDPEVAARYRADPLVQSTITASVMESLLHGMSRVEALAFQLEAPMLVLVAGSDRIVDPEGSRRFCAATPADLCEAVWFDTAYHEVFNEAEPLRTQVFEAMEQWLRRRLGQVTASTQRPASAEGRGRPGQMDRLHQIRGMDQAGR